MEGSNHEAEARETCPAHPKPLHPVHEGVKGPAGSGDSKRLQRHKGEERRGQKGNCHGFITITEPEYKHLDLVVSEIVGQEFYLFNLDVTTSCIAERLGLRLLYYEITIE
jgi:hypothetical protein